MKQVITIIISLSLYAPHVAKILAYADCSIIVLSKGDPRLCDCSRIIDADIIPMTPGHPDKQKELALKADWKYIGTASFQFATICLATGKPATRRISLFVPEQHLQAVFHPPQI